MGSAYSAVKHIKSNARNQLDSDTLAAIIRLSLTGPTVNILNIVQLKLGAH